ncbi:MAG: hypothetical protein U5K56_06010 [Halioglobus sp.]|nr:hypothetical protein [Halioglobus sp.]
MRQKDDPRALFEELHELWRGEYQAEIKTLPALILDLHKEANIDFCLKASLVRIPANVTARSGHRDRLSHRCSLAVLFLH